MSYSNVTIKKMTREECKELIEQAESLINKLRTLFRICWNCNTRNKHLKDIETHVITCHKCGEWFYIGYNIADLRKKIG